MLRFRNLKTPPDDGGILLEPPPEHWPALLEQNVQLLSRVAGTLAGVPVQEARRRVRVQLLGRAEDARIIAVGHQPELVHPGVWAKHVAVQALAKRTGAVGIDLVVDIRDREHLRRLLTALESVDGVRAVRRGRAP